MNTCWLQKGGAEEYSGESKINEHTTKANEGGRDITHWAVLDNAWDGDEGRQAQHLAKKPFFYYFALSTPLSQEEAKVHLFGNHTGLFRWHFSVLAGWSPGLLAPFLATAEKDSFQEELTPASQKKNSLLAIFQSKLIDVLAKKRPKIQTCGLADSLSPVKVACMDCSTMFSKDFFFSFPC